MGYFTPLNQTLSTSLAAYIQPSDAEATAHAPLSDKYSSSSVLESPDIKSETRPCLILHV